MTISGFLPQRWRPDAATARHAEAVAGILHTPPVEPAQPGPVLATVLGTTQVLPYLVAVKSLRQRLGRGGIAIVDDGTLTGEDRAILAHHCGDPELIPHQSVARGALPAGGAWALLLTILDRRAGEVWIALDPHTLTLGEIREIDVALGSNRSFAVPAESPRGGADRRRERRTAVLCGTRGWRYRPASPGLAGFAAGGPGRPLVAAFAQELAAIGEAATPDAARNLVLANEAEPVLLPGERYCVARDGEVADEAALVHYPEGPLHGDGYIEASRAVIERLLA